MDNIEFFNRFTLALLEHLYSQFPTPVEIDTRQLAANALHDTIDSEMSGKLLTSADSAVTFLTDEGFITNKGSYLEGGTFLQVRLTAKGLAVLNSTPDSLESRESLITRIQKTLAGGAKAAGSETVRQLTQQALTAAITVAPAIAAQLSR